MNRSQFSPHWRKSLFSLALMTAVSQSFGLLAGSGSSPVLAAEAPDTSSKKLVSAAAPTANRSAMKSDAADGTALIDKWLSASQALSDYKFDFSMTVTKKGGEVVQKGILYFRKPRQLRLEVKSGQNAGSTAVLQKDGVVKGHMGGALKFFDVALSPDSNYLKSANGLADGESRFRITHQAVEGYIKDGCTAKVAQTNGSGGKTLEWTLYHPNGVIYKRVLFNADNSLPFEWWDYVDGKLFAHSVWSNFKSNIALPDKTFKL